MIVMIVLGLLLYFYSEDIYKKGLSLILLDNKDKGIPKLFTRSIKGLGFLLVVIGILSNFILIVPANQYAMFTKKILGNSLENGSIIAVDGEMGPQAWIKREGFHLIPFVNFLYDVHLEELTEVKEGMVMTLTAKDGLPLGENEFFAPDWFNTLSEDKKLITKFKTEYPKLNFNREVIEAKMLEPDFFLKYGGKRGPQVNVLKPGKYPINYYLWSSKLAKATKIDTGFAGVVTSRAGKIYKDIDRTDYDSKKITTPLVPNGYIGVRKEALTTGNYYLNPEAYSVLPQDIRAQVWFYGGGYTPREATIAIDSSNEIVIHEIKHNYIPIPKHAADNAIEVKTKDKYSVYVELRLQVQPDPKHISAIVAGVGSLQMVEDKVITPAVRAVLRNLGQEYNAVDFVDKRTEIEAKFRELIVEKTIQAGVPAKEVFFGNIDLPPAVLLPQQVEELSLKMKQAYIQKEATYVQLIKTNETKATADQQSKLVEAKIEKERAVYMKETRQTLGEGERLYLEEVAKGQNAQKEVLGADKTYQLQMWKETLAFLKEHPEAATAIPSVYINKSGNDSGSGFDEGAAIMSIQQLMKAQKAITNDRSSK
jgi:hypothetical protein